jgi:PAS domain S-box-containing protein
MDSSPLRSESLLPEDERQNRPDSQASVESSKDAAPESSTADMSEGGDSKYLLQGADEHRPIPAALMRRAAEAQALHRAVAMAAETTSFDHALQLCVDLICELTGWPIGHAFLVDEAHGLPLVSASIWHLDDTEPGAAFREITEKTRLGRGQCLPGHVLESGQPIWIKNIQDDRTFVRGPRTDQGSVHHVKGGVGFPIKVQNHVVAVLEFFAYEEMSPDQALLRFVGSVGEQVGRVMERKDALAALQASEEKYRVLFESAPVSICLLRLDGTVLDCNPATQTMLGLTREQIIGRHCSQLNVTPKEDLERYHEFIESVVRGKNPGVVELRYQNVDGAICWTERSAALLFSASGEPFAIQLISCDTTDRKRAGDLARKHEGELVHMSRLSLMGEMASQLAHELNQPLSTVELYIRSAIRLLDARSPQVSRAVELLEKIAQQNQRAGEIIRRLRDFVRHREPRRAIADINHLVQEVYGFIEFEARLNGIVVVLDFQQGLPTVSVDAIQIEQVLLNLVRNGLEAMRDVEPSHRQLTIATRLVEEGKIEVSIRDQGPGLAPDLFPKLFQPFFTTKPDGMGMGLSICRSIIEAHSGRLWASRNADKGMTFHLELPAMQQGDLIQ